MSGRPTVAEALRQARARLSAAGADAPALDAELLLGFVLGWERSAVLARPAAYLTPQQAACYAGLIERRAGREPLAYILGRREFFGLDFEVDRRVLIPRPETEGLVELALDWLGRRPAGAPMIADVGTGSGAIAIVLARRYPTARVYGLDISTDALQVAQRNAARHGVSERIVWLAGDLLEPLPAPADLIVANLPYVAADELPALMPEVRAYEPRLALDGGADGLALVRRLLAQAPGRLRAGGALLLEIGASQGPAATAAAASFPRGRCAVRPDLAGRERYLVIET